MTAKFRRVQGDVNDTLITQLTGVATFAGATVVAHVWQGSGTATNLTASVVNGTTSSGAVCGVCTVNLSPWLATATPSLGWQLEYQVTFGDGSVLTWPDGAPDTLEVRAQGGDDGLSG